MKLRYLLSPLVSEVDPSSGGTLLAPKIDKLKRNSEPFAYSAIVPDGAKAGTLCLVQLRFDDMTEAEADSSNELFPDLGLDDPLSKVLSNAQYNALIKKLSGRGITVANVTVNSTLITFVAAIAKAIAPWTTIESVKVKV